MFFEKFENRVSNLDQIKTLAKKWVLEVKGNDGLFRKFYNFMFTYLKDENKTILSKKRGKKKTKNKNKTNNGKEQTKQK